MAQQGTRLETDEDVQRALLKYRAQESPQALVSPSPDLAPARAAAKAPAPADDAPPLFHPTERPSMAVLTVFDDGSADGQQVRIRQEEFVIGRATGDLLVPHDSQISGRHAALRRELHAGKSRWYLVDLGSTNGTYVRVGHSLLQHGQQFLIGRTRLRFDNPPPDEPGKPARVDQTTRPWSSGASLHLAPTLVELDHEGQGPRHVITADEIWIGKDAQHCQLTLPDDPFASARHARIARDDTGRWFIENNRSPNGVWLRVERIRVERSCHFLLGEQRFLVRVLGN
ncbi:MAG: FHA domain-containing protein [Pirellulales bacterium]|nr:FHA domain-containing protein [Pirellulales bacterium]